MSSALTAARSWLRVRQGRQGNRRDRPRASLSPPPTAILHGNGYIYLDNRTCRDTLIAQYTGEDREVVSGDAKVLKYYGRPPQAVQVMRTEEKGSDVNLATFLLVDCFGNDFDQAVVISNDSDLALPIELVRTQFGKAVGTVNPHRDSKLSGHLIKATSFYLRTINRSVLASCQFPSTLTDSQGTFNKPNSW